MLGLVAAVLYEHAQAHCFQTSISAYWYTPARGYFVAMLLGMSVCTACLRGSTEAEDILLSFAGMLATIVATAVIAIAGGFSHLTIWTEVALIGLFAVFWVLQTIELWTPGLRQPLGAQLTENS